MSEEKRFVVFATRTIEMEAVVYAESREEAEKLVRDGAGVDWENTGQEDTIWEAQEEPRG
jgi:hypothetical protein